MLRSPQVLFWLGLLLASLDGLAAAVPDGKQGVKAAATPWRDGERLYYEIDFAFLTAAKGVFRAKRGDGHDHLVLELRTSGLAGEIYPITSKFWSRQTLAPWRSIEYGEDRDENGDINREKNTVDYAAGKATRERYSDQQTDTYKVARDDFLSDLVSMNYGLRVGPWKEGDRRKFTIHEGGKLKPAEAVCQGIREESVAGWPRQRLIHLRVEPKGEYEGKGALDYYLTDDKQRLPLLAKLKFAYGTAHIRLVKAERKGGPTREVPAE